MSPRSAPARLACSIPVRIENDTFNPVTASANYIPVSGGGVSGLVLDEPRGLLYVMTRFDDAVKVIDLKSSQEVAGLAHAESRACLRWCKAGRCYTTRRNSRAMAKHPAPVATFSATWTTSRGILGNPDNPVTTSPIPINFGGLLHVSHRCGPDRRHDAHQRQQQPHRLPSDERAVHHADVARHRNFRRDALARRPVHGVLRHRSVRFQSVLHEFCGRFPDFGRQRLPAVARRRCRTSRISSCRLCRRPTRCAVWIIR